MKGNGLEREGEKKRSAWISRAFMTVIGFASQPSQLEAEWESVQSEAGITFYGEHLYDQTISE